MSVNDEEIQLEIKNQNLYQMSDIKNENQRRAPSKSVYESGLSDKVRRVGIAKQKSAMINGEHVYQSVMNMQKYSTKRVKNSIFATDTQPRFIEYDYYDAEFEYFPDAVQFEIKQERVNLLIDEIYNNDNGGFMGFFSTNKVKKISSRLDTHSASNVFSVNKNGRNSIENESNYGTQNTFRNVEYHRNLRSERQIETP